MPSISPLTFALLVSIAVGATAAQLAWRERPEPGATPLVWLLGGQIWWSIFLIFQLHAPTVERKLSWLYVEWVGTAIVPVAWILFALEYTGRDQYVRLRYITLLSIVPAITIAIALTGNAHSLLYDTTDVAINEVGLLELSPGPWFWVIAAYTYLLGLIGSVPLLGLVQSDALPFRAQSIALLVGILAPWASNALFLAGLVPIPGFDPTPLAFSVSGVAYLGALTRFRLLGTSPSPNRRARRLVFERMQEAAMVVDSHDYVVDMNASAAAMLGVRPEQVLGSPAAEVVPEYERLPKDGAATGYVTVENGDVRQYAVTVTLVEDFHGRSIGRAINFHDISEQLRQQQRLEVLNRVLRHNIRTETSVIYGYTDVLAEADEEKATVVKEHTERIEELGEKAREIIDIFERGRETVTPVRLDLLLGENLDAVCREYPDVTYECSPVPEDVYVPGMVDPVIGNVVENAAEHNDGPDPHVRVEVVAGDGDDQVEVAEADGDDQVEIVVTDDGPGIKDDELAVLERKKETPLAHGSGLGLWLVTWGAEIAGGQVTFEDNEPTGTIVTLTLPVHPNPEG